MTVYISQGWTLNRGCKPASVRIEEPSFVNPKRRDEVVYFKIAAGKGRERKKSVLAVTPYTGMRVMMQPQIISTRWLHT